MLLGRAQESAVIDQLLSNARSSGSGAIVIKGEAGIGKSALLDYAAQLASGMRVLRVSGVESEAEIAFGALHLLLHEQLALIDSLPTSRPPPCGQPLERREPAPRTGYWSG